jgi:hypothetical protein
MFSHLGWTHSSIAGGTLRACRKSICLDPPKRPMIFVNVNLLGGRPFRSMRRAAGQPRTQPARRDREYHRQRSRGGRCPRDHGRQSAMERKRIRSFADRRQPVWLAKEPGEQGSAKTVLSKMLKALADPNAATSHELATSRMADFALWGHGLWNNPVDSKRDFTGSCRRRSTCADRESGLI